MSQVTGPGTRQIQALRTRLATLPELFRKQASEAMGKRALRLVRDGFSSKQDPYGQRWAPRKVRKRAGLGGRIRSLLTSPGRGLLVKTGALRGGFKVSPTPDGFEMSNPTGYGAFHQYGTRKMVRRQMVPEEDTGGLGATWGNAFNEEAERVIKNILASIG
jgi:hypothetical protein